MFFCTATKDFNTLAANTVNYWSDMR
ncbi:hypothetical protein SAMN05216192_1051 [Paenibacillus typhae]|uniref:Uncharacterized protein n=1 Tax=Paenibacillus typhae TaxID=1174501 RepID=A0A1G8K130_9BACL|nr:hypothetical protein SAMN05216192_1051 [Paenibacillus typhae]